MQNGVLEPDDVKDYSLEKTLREMEEGNTAVLAIKDRSPEQKLAMAEGDDADKVAILLQTLNVLGERHDALKELKDADDKVIKLRDYLKVPDGPVIPQGAGKAGLVVPQYAGDIIADSPEWAAAKERGTLIGFNKEIKWSDVMSTKAILGEDDTLAGVGSEFPPQSIRIPGIRVPVLFQPNNISLMFLQGTTDQHLISYMQEVVTDEGAAETLEGGTKPEGDISFVQATAPVQNIPVLLPVTDQLLEDEAFMRSWVEGRLRLFVLNREDLQLISGDGVAPNLEGILTVAGTGSQSYSIAAAVLDATVAFDAVYNGLTDVRQAFLSPSGIAMASATWERFRLGKDANNNYLLGPPASEAATRLWGLPVTINERMPAEANPNEAIFVAAREAAEVTRRNELRLSVSDSHGTTFAENVLTFKAEMRTAFVYWRPAGISIISTLT